MVATAQSDLARIGQKKGKNITRRKKHNQRTIKRRKGTKFKSNPGSRISRSRIKHRGKHRGSTEAKKDHYQTMLPAGFRGMSWQKKVPSNVAIHLYFILSAEVSQFC